jgi:hypothetical protein
MYSGTCRLAATVGAAVLLVVLGLTACGSGTPSGQGELPAYVESYMASATDFQRAAIEDGTVTAAEYEAAVLATLQCAEEQGILHSTPVLTQGGVSAPKWRYVLGPWPEDQDAEFQSAFDQCFDDYQSVVVGVWVQQEGPTGEELIDAQERIAQCMRERGLEDVRNYDAFLALMPTLTDTQLQIADNCASLIWNGVDRFNE